jgi:membrane protein DedA with SNARE-associated domain
MGALVAAGSLDFLSVWAGAAAGAVGGSTASWWVGHQFGSAILSRGPFEDRTELAARGTEALHKWGAWAVLIAHVFPPLTSVVFLLAGIGRIPFWRFQAFNLPGAAIWAWFLPVTGELGTYLILKLWTAFSGA